METWKSVFTDTKDHKLHVAHHKITVLPTLKTELPRNTILMRWDFLMNYTHISSVEVGNAFYGRRQSSLLIATVWMHTPTEVDGETKITKQYHSFVSHYLAHSTIFFQKAFIAILPLLELDQNVENIIIITDGGMQHFKNRRSMFWASKLEQQFDFKFRWIVDPAYHGKGECDGRGALLKKSARLHILKGTLSPHYVFISNCLFTENGFIDDATQLNDYFNQVPGGHSTLLNIDYDDTEEDCSALNGIKSCFDFIFPAGTGNVSMRKWPCNCTQCMSFNFNMCLKSVTVGQWQKKHLNAVGILHPKGIAPSTREEITVTNSVHYEVEAVVGKRIFQGKTQYQIKWKGWDNSYNQWTSVNDLACEHLIREFEDKN